MDIHSLKQPDWTSRFIHILILAAIVAPGIYFRPNTIVAAVTAAWFLLFTAVYLLVSPGRH